MIDWKEGEKRKYRSKGNFYQDLLSKRSVRNGIYSLLKRADARGSADIIYHDAYRWFSLAGHGGAENVECCWMAVTISTTSCLPTSPRLLSVPIFKLSHRQVHLTTCVGWQRSPGCHAIFRTPWGLWRWHATGSCTPGEVASSASTARLKFLCRSATSTEIHLLNAQLAGMVILMHMLFCIAFCSACLWASKFDRALAPKNSAFTCARQRSTQLISF